MRKKPCRCFVCTGTPLKWKCRGQFCHTVDQCCREIFDVSYKIKEYMPLVLTVRKAMLPR